METNYKDYRLSKNISKSPLYRLLWPHHADFTPKSNRFVGRDQSQNYNTKTGAFPTLTHNYSDHTL